MGFICPICKAPLDKSDKLYSCINHHSFDISAKGYVNLLLSQSTHGHGDDKAMAVSRRDFLAAGYYNPLIDCVSQTVADSMSEGGILLDAGCGECAYTLSALHKVREKGINATFYGIDISKEILSLTGKRCEGIERAVASVYDIPMNDASCDTVMSVFSPFAKDEFIRVLKPGGTLIRVFPLENHLYALKKAVYENAYRNEPEPYDIKGFSLCHSKEIKYVIHLNNNRDILNLFSMTPYYHKTSPKDIGKLSVINELDTEAEFAVAVYKKV